MKGRTLAATVAALSTSTAIIAEAANVFRAYDDSDHETVRAMCLDCALNGASDNTARDLAAQWQNCLLSPTRPGDWWDRAAARIKRDGRVFVSNGKVAMFYVYGRNPETDVVMRDGKRLSPISTIAFNLGVTGTRTVSLSMQGNRAMLEDMQALGYDGFHVRVPFSLDHIPGYPKGGRAMGINSEVVGTDPVTGQPTAWEHWALFADHLPHLLLVHAAMNVSDA